MTAMPSELSSCPNVRLQKAGEELVVPNALGSMLQEAGAVGLNAATSHDNTQ
jgi:hypothetical protein